ncbi:ABC transporter permease [Clostridium sp. D2Q-11]|uniref:ABC transporter permease n=1 Tax=Anaeromonas frigoriresistens TaxID=2683708 RepID=A0A942V347_9FIRM|nr:ABC transporter permease [Anaeromonas frigoriresistens]MBS4539087.1 ABC transporter permease [Anaeromonas frigoriresistens]
MKVNKKFIINILINIIVTIITLTFILFILNLPKNTYVNIDIKKFNIETNIQYKQIFIQVMDYYKMLLSGTFGKTTTSKVVWRFVKSGFKNSFIILSFSLFFAITLGIIKGIFDSKKHKRYPSNLKTLSTLTILAMPDVFLILVLQFFAVILYRNGFEFLPAAGFGGWKYTILPITALTLIPMSYIARITSLSIDENYEKNYVTTALGKGASNKRIIYIHIIRNAIMDILDSFTSIATIIISTLLLVEYMFGYPGLALIMFKNYESGEVNVVMAMAIMIGLMYFVLNILFKILRYILNPKLRGGAS